MNIFGRQAVGRSLHHRRAIKKTTGCVDQWIGTSLIWGAVCLAAMWGCTKKSSRGDVLIRVGDSVVMVTEFQAYVEDASEEVFSGEKTVNPRALNDLRMRTLNQLIEEMVISERAQQIGVRISDAELEQAVQAVKADYPDHTFEKTLLENAVSFSAWKKKLATRLLVDKVIAKELVDKVEITSDDVSAYFQAHYPQGPPQGEGVDQLNRKIVIHLRRQKAEEMYLEWIEALKSIYPAHVDRKHWNALVGTNNEIE